MSVASRLREQARRAALPPRNPTWLDSRRGAPPLSDLEWGALRDWQTALLARYTDTPEAKAARVQSEAAFATGIPLSFPVPDEL